MGRRKNNKDLKDKDGNLVYKKMEDAAKQSNQNTHEDGENNKRKNPFSEQFNFREHVRKIMKTTKQVPENNFESQKGTPGTVIVKENQSWDHSLNKGRSTLNWHHVNSNEYSRINNRNPHIPTTHEHNRYFNLRPLKFDCGMFVKDYYPTNQNKGSYYRNKTWVKKGWKQ